MDQSRYTGYESGTIGFFIQWTYLKKLSRFVLLVIDGMFTVDRYF
jgi:hypothetical protein